MYTKQELHKIGGKICRHLRKKYDTGKQQDSCQYAKRKLHRLGQESCSYLEQKAAGTLNNATGTLNISIRIMQ